MSEPLPQSPAPKPRGIPIWTALVALILLIVVAGGVLAGILYYTRNDDRKAQVAKAALAAQKQQAAVAEEKVVEDAKVTAAKNRQEEALRDVRAATNALQRLMVAAESVRTDADALKASDEGRKVALHPSLVRLARQLYEVNLPVLPPAADIVSRLEAARRIEEQIAAAAGTTFVPGPELTGEAQQASAWAGDQTRKADEIRTLLRTLSQEAKVRVTTETLTASSPTLEVAIQRLTAAELAAQQQVATARTEEAKKSATETVADAEAVRIREDAQRDAARIIAEAEAKKATVERELAMKKADQVKEDTKTKVEVETVLDEARMIELRKKAADPEIQRQLAPFTTAGTFQVRGKKFVRAYDNTPLSLKELQAYGALNTNLAGLQRLVDIATANADKDRPRWRVNPKFWSGKPDTLEMVKQTQLKLIELGPALVEMKLLEP